MTRSQFNQFAPVYYPRINTNYGFGSYGRSRFYGGGGGFRSAGSGYRFNRGGYGYGFNRGGYGFNRGFRRR